MGMTAKQAADLRALLSTDVDYVLDWLYGKVHEDLPALLEELVGILCDRTNKPGVRHNAAAAAQGIGLGDAIIAYHGLPDLLTRIERVHRNATESESIRASALGAWACLSIERKTSGEPSG